MDLYVLPSLANEGHEFKYGDANDAVMEYNRLFADVYHVGCNDGGHDGTISCPYGPHVCLGQPKAQRERCALRTNGGICVGLPCGVECIQYSCYRRSVGLA